MDGIDGEIHSGGDETPIEAQPLAPEVPGGGSRAPWLAAAAVLAVGVLGVGALVVSSDSDDSASSALPRLGVTQDVSPQFASVAEDMYAPTYELVGELPDLGTTATVYEVEGSVTDEVVANWASALGVGQPAQTESGWTAEGPDGFLNVEAPAAGPVSVQYSPRYAFPGVGAAIEPYDPSVVTTTTTPMRFDEQTNSSPPVDVPSDDEALAIATQLLTRMGVVDEAWSFESSAGTQSVGCAVPDDASDDVASLCGPSEPQIWSRTVVATTTVDGNPTDSLFWNVTIGSGGKIESVSGAHGTVTPLGDYTLQPTAAAFAQLQDGSGIILNRFTSFGWSTSSSSTYETTETTTAFETVAPPSVADPGIREMPLTTTTHVPGSAPDPNANNATKPDETVATAPDMAPPDSGVIEGGAIEPDFVPYVPEPIRINGAHLGLASVTGQIDGAPAGLLVPVYVFEEESDYQGEGYEPGISVVALQPGSFEIVAPQYDTPVITGTTQDDDDMTGTTATISPSDPPVDLPCASATIPEVCQGTDGATTPGSTGSADGSSGGSDGSGSTGGPVTTIPPEAPDAPVSSSPASGASTTVPR